MQVINNSSMVNWKDELKKLKLEHIKKTSPGFFELSGGNKMKVKQYSDQNTNGLTAAVCAWLTYNGHYCNRINSQGQVRVEKVQCAGGRVIQNVRYTKGTTNKGTAVVMGLINGKSIHIEIKCKATGDKIREDQIKERDRIVKAGGIYLIVQDMQSFVEWYKAFILNNSEPVQMELTYQTP